MTHIPDIEKLSLEQQKEVQNLRLKALLGYLEQHSPFYRRWFQTHALNIAEINTVADLHKIPAIGKQELQSNNHDFFCVSPGQIREYVSTSGTTGAPVIVPLTEKDLQRLAYNEYLSFNCIETSAADRFQLMLTLDRQFMAGMAYYSGIRQLGASAIRTGPGLPSLQWDTIHSLQTSTLITVPSFLLKMISYAKEHNIQPGNSSIRKVLAIGESLRHENMEPNALLSNIESAWNIQLFSTYASTEMQTAFTARKGGHHHPELIIVELLDEQGQPVAEELAGEVTITTLGVEGMPLLRYRTGDICKAYYQPCSCGRQTIRLGPVLGRKQQMIKLKGTTLYPPALFDLLNSTNEIAEYYIEVFHDEQEQDNLYLYIHTLVEAGTCDELIKPLLRHKLRVIPHIKYVSLEKMQQLQFPEGSRKQIRFKDLRNFSKS
jgi:phenylacetate-CoA ligase